MFKKLTISDLPLLPIVARDVFYDDLRSSNSQTTEIPHYLYYSSSRQYICSMVNYVESPLLDDKIVIFLPPEMPDIAIILPDSPVAQVFNYFGIQMPMQRLVTQVGSVPLGRMFVYFKESEGYLPAISIKRLGKCFQELDQAFKALGLEHEEERHIFYMTNIFSFLESKAGTPVEVYRKVFSTKKNTSSDYSRALPKEFQRMRLIALNSSLLTGGDNTLDDFLKLPLKWATEMYGFPVRTEPY